MKGYKRKKCKGALPAKPRMNGRIFLVGSIFIMCLCGLFGRVVYIQTAHGEEYKKVIANRMINGEEDVEAQRGAIVDRNNKTLATSTLAYNVILSPKDILTVSEEKRLKVYKTLAPVVGKSVEELQKLVDANPTSQHKVLAKHLDTEIGETLQGLSGVSLVKTYLRKYPKGTLAAQVLGFYNKNGVGQYGIEQQYEEYLAGVPGRVFSQYQDSRIVTKETQEGQAGATIKLTLDEIIQQYVQTTMQKYIKEWDADNASALIMNPNTGEVYSMYSYPEFDPNHYNNLADIIGKDTWNSLSGEEQYEKLNAAWINRSIQYTYEPGSTFKPIFIAAALDEGIIDGSETYNCTGGSTVADTRIGCWKTDGHGVQTIEDVLANSCNVGMIEISKKMDSEVVLNYIKRYGFGENTSINLPGDNAGLLHSKLGPVEKATYSMGQGLTVTPLQLVSAFSAVINGGYLVEPYVVSEITASDSSILFNHEKRILRQVISTETSKKVANYLKKVVETGTGTGAAVSGYDVGGKTGTAQKLGRIDGDYVLSFIGYAPINNPQVVCLITFDNIPEGTGAPANAFREIMENILPYLEIELSDTTVQDEVKTSTVPNVSNKDIYSAINELVTHHLDYEIVGVGNTVTSQYPKADETAAKGLKVKLYVSAEDTNNVKAVPNIMGMTLDEAKEALGEDFTLEGSGKGKIISQVPRGGTKIELNSKVIVKVSEKTAE